MPRCAHFGDKGGLPTFAASANQTCRDIGSRHSGDPETRFSHALRRSGLSPKYRMQQYKKNLHDGRFANDPRGCEVGNFPRPAIRWWFLQDRKHPGHLCAVEIHEDAKCKSTEGSYLKGLQKGLVFHLLLQLLTARAMPPNPTRETRRRRPVKPPFHVPPVLVGSYGVYQIGVV